MEKGRYIIEILRSLDWHGGAARIESVYQDVLDALRSDLLVGHLSRTFWH